MQLRVNGAVQQHQQITKSANSMDIVPDNLQAPKTSNVGLLFGPQIPAPLLESIPSVSSISNSSADSLPIEEVCEFAKHPCCETECLQNMSEELFYSPSLPCDLQIDNSHESQKTPTQSDITLPAIPQNGRPNMPQSAHLLNPMPGTSGIESSSMSPVSMQQESDIQAKFLDILKRPPARLHLSVCHGCTRDYCPASC